MACNFFAPRWRGIALAALFVALMPLTGFAADLSVPLYSKAPPMAAPSSRMTATYNWSGFYVGGTVGYLWGRTHVDDDGVDIEHNAKTNGTIAGAIFGYSWQINRFVFGLEGDIAWSNAHGVGAEDPPPPPPPPPAAPPPPVLIPVTTHGPNSYNAHWTSRARGRFGYAFDNWQVFAAFGLAAADLNFQEGAINTVLVPASVNGGKYYGWSIGAGVEWAFASNFIARVEYFYDDYGHKDYIGVLNDPYRVSLTGQSLRAALAYKFDPFGR
jgi:outer membrane immunogenic protein